MSAVLLFPCYCGSGQIFSACCEPLISGQAKAQSPEELMRSRYSAYCHHHKNPQCYRYIMETYHSSVRAAHTETEIADFARAVHFVGLKILSDSSQKKPQPQSNQVHFVASYLVGDRLEKLDEVSDFEMEQGHWMYRSGVLTEHPAVRLSRNDICPCGSGIKFKKCQHQV
ncbi:hypothetical protein EMM73_00595 [Rheinheimera sediminis]|uniref:YchJ family protein n=1 Tax=Rheinheimera sp. YQF-1 TaxID=2499626 RepID=UPI000FD8299E|nr:YchJ family metal-binding protein [Rheinheimera sp. YQF-1]RVT49135.1 hypothetical protein EMM73_00595 [Rheinheimera sp. YQF-1]